MEYSSEELNFFRVCYIAFNLVPEALRKIFKQEWDFRYRKPPFGGWNDTLQNGRDFFSKETKRSRKRNGRYLATIQNGNTAEWDCSCLFFAILFSDSIGTTLSPVIYKEVDDLRKVRNDIAHNGEATLTDAQFQTYAGRVLSAFTSLGLPISDIEEVKNQTSFPTEEVEDLKKKVDDLITELDEKASELEETKNALQTTQDDLHSAKEENKALTQEINSKLEPFCSLSPTPPHDIITRSNDIARITRKMQDLYDENNEAVSTIYLSGNPGCGKSQLARRLGENFYSFMSRKTEGLTFVATLNAETLESLADSYMTLAKNLGITEYAITKMEKLKRKKPEETLRQVMLMISQKIPNFSNWLIIADNVVHLPLVRSFLPQTSSKEWGHGQVLITTQDSGTIPLNAPHTYHESLSKGMQPHDAIELLKRVSQISNQEQTEKVAEVLEYQPLALAAAAYYVRTVVSGGSPNYSWVQYLDRLCGGQREATEEFLAIESTAYSNTMTTAVRMAIERAMKDNEVLRQAFSLFSVCAQESLPVEVVLTFVRAYNKREVIDEMIKAQILRSSLFLSSSEDDGAPKYLRLHNIVHDVLRTMQIFDPSSSQKYRCISTAIATFESQFKDRIPLSKEIHGYQEITKLVTHSKVICGIAFPNDGSSGGLPLNNLTPFINPDKVVSWLSSAALACLDISDPLHGKRFSELACDFLQSITSKTEETLLKSDVFQVRGLVLQEVCDYKSALLYLHEALKIAKAIDNEENSHAAKIYDSLGNVSEEIGELHQAKEFHEKALAIRKKIHPEHNHEVAGSYNNLGNVCKTMGQHQEAKEFYEKALVISEKVCGEQHGDVGTVNNNLGTVCWEIGQHNQAKRFYKKALTIAQNVFGENHADVARSYDNLGLVCSTIGEYKESKEFNEMALIIRKKIYGEEHQSIARCYNNLGMLCRATGDYNKAKEFHEKALKIKINIYGKEHADVAQSYNNLGTVCSHLAQHNRAKEFHEKALAIRKKFYGEKHRYVASSYVNLGVVCSEIGQYNEAKKFSEKALIMSKELYGEDHGHVAASYSNLGNIFYDTGRYNQAKEFHEKALFIRKKICSKEHPDLAESYNNLGTVLSSMAHYQQAKEFLEKALVISKTNYGEKHDFVATSLNNLGVVSSETGHLSEAKAFYEKALMVSKMIHGEEHGNVAASYNNLGTVCSEFRQYEQAKKFFETALHISKTIYAEEHGYVAASCNNLATVCSGIGQYQQAKELLEKALIISVEFYGEEHAHVAASYSNLGDVCDDIGEHSQACEFREKALIIRRKIHGRERSDVATPGNGVKTVCSGSEENSQSKVARGRSLIILKIVLRP